MRKKRSITNQPMTTEEAAAILKQAEINLATNDQMPFALPRPSQGAGRMDYHAGLRYRLIKLSALLRVVVTSDAISETQQQNYKQEILELLRIIKAPRATRLHGNTGEKPLTTLVTLVCTQLSLDWDPVLAEFKKDYATQINSVQPVVAKQNAQVCNEADDAREESAPDSSLALPLHS